jgi:Transmembrane secretion effector
MTILASPPEPLWRRPQFRAYMAATACTTFGYSMQQLLINVLLIDRLDASAAQVGIAQAVIGLPGLALMLWGGANADRLDGRALLIRTYAAMAMPSLLLAVASYAGVLQFWAVVAWALAIAVCNSVASPALQAMLNRICSPLIQQGVTVSTIIGFVVQACGLMLAGLVETLGATSVLTLQALVVLTGSFMVTRLSPAPAPAIAQSGERPSTLGNIRDGLLVVWDDRILRDLMSLNFLSTLFNAGAFTIVLPFLVLKAHAGEAYLLAVTMAVFYGGAMASSFLLLQFMPIRQLGRLFLLMQLSRALILVGLWLQLGAIGLTCFTFLWGVNMGVTNTTLRAIVQERANPAFRGRVLSVLNLGQLGAIPIAALTLGAFVQLAGAVPALLPGVLASAAIFVWGRQATGIWNHRSPTEAA